MEALASFGGSGLDSVLKNKTETFRDKLEKDKLKLKVIRVCVCVCVSVYVCE